jgi:hypothetical protein
VDEALKRAFTDAYLRYEIAFAQFTTSNSVRAQEGEQQARYRELADAQYAFFQTKRICRRRSEPQQRMISVHRRRPSPRQLRRSPSRNLFRSRHPRKVSARSRSERDGLAFVAQTEQCLACLRGRSMTASLTWQADQAIVATFSDDGLCS